MPRVEVVYALPDRQEIVTLDLPAGATAQEALERSGIDGRGLRLGISGRLCAPGTRLHEGDRVELYRPLVVDPKQARRARARRRTASRRGP